MSRHKRLKGLHKGRPTNHKAEAPPRRGRKVTVAAVALAVLGVAPAGAYTIQRGDTLHSIAREHSTTAQRLARINRIDNPDLIYAGDRLRLRLRRDVDRRMPVSRSTSRVAARDGDGMCQGPRGQLEVPVSPWDVTQPYAGPYPAHSGIDFAGPAGSIVRAIAPGRVTQVHRWDYSYGLNVVVRHECGYTSRYAHLSAITVVDGERVSTNEVVGTRGSTGNSTGPHLHLEVEHRGAPRNPAGWLW